MSTSLTTDRLFEHDLASEKPRLSADQETRPLRVLLVQQFFPPYRVPIFCKLASHAKIELTLLHGTSPGVHPGEIGLQKVTEEMPFRVVRSPIPGLRWRTTELLWFSRALKLVRQERFDVVIHNFATRWASLGSLRRLQHANGGAFILWGIGVSQVRTPWLDRLRMSAVRKADAAIFYCDRDRQRYIDRGARPDKLFVARNSVDLCPIDSAMKQLANNGQHRQFRRDHGLDQGPVLLSVGRISQDKRLDLLLRASAALKTDFPDIRVVLVGHGPETESLKRMAAELGMQEHVVLPGAVTQEEKLAAWFHASDVIVAPGQIGLLAVHAAAYGRPVVTSDNASLQGPEVEVMAPNATGLLYRFPDERDLVRQIRTLLVDTDRRTAMGEAAYRRVRKECGIPNMANGVLKAIQYAARRDLSLFDGD